MQLMIVNADTLTGAAVATSLTMDGSSGLFDANTWLMMLAYRRTRLLEDIADPTKVARASPQNVADSGTSASLDMKLYP